MKYNQGKIKKEHHLMKEFLPLLHALEKVAEVQRIIPGKIARQQSGSSFLGISYSYNTPSWLKYMMKKWGTAQELFITCAEADSEHLKHLITVLSKEHL
jgi:hypothetical protein